MKKYAFLIASGAMFFFAPDCKPASGPSADGGEAGALTAPVALEAGIAVVDGACTLLMGVDSTGTLTTICATIEEVAKIVGFVLTLRSASDAGAPLADEKGCIPLPYSRVCATEGELSKAISFIVQQRRAALTRDGGK